MDKAKHILIVAAFAGLAAGQVPSGYRYFRFLPTKIRGSAGMVQISEIALRSNGKQVSMSGALATNPSGKNPNNEDPSKAIDSSTGTKWLDYNTPSQGLVIDFRTAVQADSFSFTTANDVPDRDPVQWTLSGSTNGVDWVVLHLQNTDYSTTDGRFKQTDWFSWQTKTTPPTPVPTPRPTPRPTPVPTPVVGLSSGGGWNILKGKCSINMSTGEPCVVSPNYPKDYPAEELCRVSVTGKLEFVKFATEKWFDHLKIGEAEYSGSMTGTVGTNASELIWSSDFYIEGPGWMLCKSKEANPKV